MTTIIDCQACPPKDSGNSLTGCSICGGYRMVLVKGQTICCKREFWVRPGVSTSRVGQHRYSFDGVALAWSERGYLCEDHYEQERANG